MFPAPGTAGCRGAVCHLYTRSKRATQAAEKVGRGWRCDPQRLKPDSLQRIYVRPEGRTLRENEFFRSQCSYFPSESGGVCWRILARVLRFQMATAIPPKAAEVAIKRPERQGFRRSGWEGLSSGACARVVGTRSKRNLRSGMGQLSKKCRKKVLRETYFSEPRLFGGRVKLSLKDTVIGI